jgi:hypothetical protein
MKFKPNQIDESEFFNERKCKRCKKSLESKRSDAIYCSRNCKSIERKCNKSKEKTLEKWKQTELIKVNQFKELIQKILEGGK